MIHQAEKCYRILIVDDQENNRLVIEDILRRLNSEIRGVASGELALELLSTWLPDLILMDQMMPSWDGIETTRKIKEIPQYAEIPVVIVTAKEEIETLKDAFEAGAVDYIVKPVDKTTLSARVKSVLRTKQAYDDIKHLTEQLEAQKQELTNFTQMVSHDLKSPIASSMSLIDFFIYRLKTEYPQIWQDQSFQNLLIRVPKSLNKMLHFIDTLLQYANTGKVVGEMQEISMQDIVNEVLETFTHLIEQGIVKITIDLEMPICFCDPLKIGQIWQNLIGNAIKYRGEISPVEIHLGWTKNDQQYQFWVQDNGPGISKEHQEKVFLPFVRLQSNVEGNGIGLATVQKVIEAHGGQIQIDSEYEQGAKFVFDLPMH